MMRLLLLRGAIFSLALGLAGICLTSPIRAHAQMAVIDHAVLATVSTIAGLEGEQVTKDNVLDAVAWNVANMVIASISHSIINWINSGFDGSPAFVTDLRENLAGLSDAVAAEFIGQLADGLKDSPMRGTVEALAYGYYLSTNGDSYFRKQLYTLRDTVQNDTAFVHNGDFSQGGWRGWFALTTNPANNPHGTLISAKQELNRRIEAQLDQRLKELDWGNGFLSLKGGSCKKDTVSGSASAPSLGDVGECLGGKIQTPGSVIEAQLNSSLGLSQQKLVVADEINEIIGALVSQLTLQALQGLDSLGSTSSGGSGYLDRIEEESQSGSAPGGIDNLLLSGVEAQVAAVGGYATAWQTIGQAADGALQCADTTGTDRATAESAKAGATTASARAASALQSLSEVVSSIRAASSLSPQQKTARMQQIAVEYQTLTQGAVIPGAAEIADANAAIATTTPIGGEPSLLMELTRMQNACAPTS